MSLNILGAGFEHFTNFPEQDKLDIARILASAQLTFLQYREGIPEFFALSSRQIMEYILIGIDKPDCDGAFTRIWDRCDHNSETLLEFLQGILEFLVREKKLQRFFNYSDDANAVACYSRDGNYLVEQVTRNMRKN